LKRSADADRTILALGDSPRDKEHAKHLKKNIDNTRSELRNDVPLTAE
jgi:hypothetical protein